MFQRGTSVRPALTGDFGLVGIQLVVERLQSDPQLGSGFGFVTVVLFQHFVDHVHFDFTKRLR